MIWHALLHSLGIDQGYAYGSWNACNFWSGAGSDLGYLGVVAALWRKHNCHEGGCWRIGRHLVDGSPWCDLHHAGARSPVLEVKLAAGARTVGTGRTREAREMPGGREARG